MKRVHMQLKIDATFEAERALESEYDLLIAAEGVR